jgi:ribosome biogenesis GTPase A
VGRNAYDEEEVALELLSRLKGPYPELLAARYKLDDASAIPGLHDDVLLELIGRKRGAVMSGGRVNLTKAAEIVLNDFRSAIMGRITLESPDEFEVWWAEGVALEVERQRKKAARLQKKKKGPATTAPADEFNEPDDEA